MEGGIGGLQQQREPKHGVERERRLAERGEELRVWSDGEAAEQLEVGEQHQRLGALCSVERRARQQLGEGLRRRSSAGGLRALDGLQQRGEAGVGGAVVGGSEAQREAHGGEGKRRRGGESGGG